MIGAAGEGSERRIYLLTALAAVLGFAAFWPTQGFKYALAFVLGALASIGNLFLFGYLSRAISPEGAGNKPWEGRAFISRYLLMFGGGYVIVKTLGVNPLAVILGLLTSTVAVVVSIIIELLERLITRLSTNRSTTR